MRFLFGALRAQGLELAFLLAIALFYLFNIGWSGFTVPNETLIAQAAREMAQNNHWGVPWFNQQEYFQQPPLMVWLTLWSYKLFGISLASARLPAVLMSMGSLIMVFLFVEHVFKNRIAALVSSLVLASTCGFFWLSRLDTESSALVFLFMGFIYTYWLWTNVAKRPRFYKKELELASWVMGGLLGVMSLAGGLPAICVTLGVVGLHLWATRSLNIVETLNGKSLMGLAFGIPLVIPLIAGIIDWNFAAIPRLIFEPQWGVLARTAMFNGAIDRFAFDFVRFVILDLAPWNLIGFVMLVEGLVSLRSGGFGLDNEAMFIGSWLVVGVLVLLMAGPSYPAGALFVIPPFAIAVSLYMDRCLRASHPSPYFQIGVDLGIVLALVLAVALADGFFYKLPDVYPSALWSLPGTPVTITAGEDPAIPLWKLWFLPGPFLLLFGAVLIFLFTVFQRLQALPFVVSGVSLLMLFFANTVLMPIFYPPLAEYLSTRLQSHLKTTRYATQQESPKFYLLARSDQMASLIYYLNQNPEQPLRLMRSRRALQTAIQQAGPEEPIVGILNERDYYQLPDALREQLEVVAAQQIWDLQRTAIIKTWMSEVDASQNYVLLVKQVPAHLKEAQDAVSEDTPAETW